MSRGLKIAIGASTLLMALVAVVLFATRLGLETYEVERTNIVPARVEDLLVDDKLEDKRPTFDPALIHSRPFGDADNPWQVNLSAAVIRLDVPDLRDDSDAALLRLYPNYAAAATALSDAGLDVLPSVNLLGGKAKQFDDGLYAAIDAWAVRNTATGVADLERLIRQLMTELDPENEPHGWLWAALEVGGLIGADEYTRRPSHAERFAREFLATEAAQPVGFYNWNEELRRTFRFLRYLQQPLRVRAGIPDAISRVLARDPEWLEQYERILALYAGLTNPFDALSFLPLTDSANADKSLPEIARAANREPTAHFLPYSTSRETELFERLYPSGLPPGADLMRDFIKAIRDGKLDLKPREDAGWYEYQIHALETFLLPERGRENEKLLLTKKYKLRMLEAFKAMVTKTRETHIRQSANAVGSAAPRPAGALQPRLRCEPNPTYYLRIARSYAFVQQLLMAQVQDLNTLQGWREDGRRELPLGDELENMRMLFYGLYFVSCEDIGLRPETLQDEADNPEYLRALAAKWLESWRRDPDFAADTRVAVPIYEMPSQYTRFWCTLGVRPIKLTASYARAPSWRTASQPDPEGPAPKAWEEVPGRQLESAHWVILADEFAEVQRPGNLPLTRKELRDICDYHGDKRAIIRALGQ